jgi:signal transduction histidine kinase
MKTIDLKQDTILLIDDIPDNLAVLCEFLHHANFEVLVTASGEQGLETALYALPDLILLDVLMPGINGFEVCRQLKSQDQTRDIPIIFMTALTHPEHKIKGFQLGAADYITKPFQQAEVLARIHTHLTIRKQQRLLQTRNQELDVFAHTVAHDLKNPLSGIAGMMEVVLEDCVVNSPVNATTIKQLRVVKQAAQQGLNIIGALLKLAGVSRQAQVEFEPLNMSQIVAQVTKQYLAPMVAESQGQISLPDQWPVALGYAPWVEEVWTNYLSNGLKYGGTPPQLQLGSTSQSDGMIRFWVRDNGPGLTPEAQSQLFTPFVRLQKVRAEGHGLGLTIVQQIVAKLGGETGVESEVGQGSLFYFTLRADSR